MPTEKHPNY